MVANGGHNICNGLPFNPINPCIKIWFVAQSVNAMNDKNIILVGFMGCGKTTVGKILAARLGKKFIDMDTLIEERTGKAISQIFAENGEPVFRRIERNLVVELAEGSNQVIAAGGGIILNPLNITDFSRSGRVICLMASEEVIFRRVSSSSARPLLENGDKMQKIRQLFASRRPLYESIRDRVDTSDMTPEEVAQTVIRMLTNET